MEHMKEVDMNPVQAWVYRTMLTPGLKAAWDSQGKGLVFLSVYEKGEEIKAAVGEFLGRAAFDASEEQRKVFKQLGISDDDLENNLQVLRERRENFGQPREVQPSPEHARYKQNDLAGYVVGMLSEMMDRGVGEDDVLRGLQDLRQRGEVLGDNIEKFSKQIDAAIAMSEKQQQAVDKKIENDQSQSSILGLFKVDVGKEPIVNQAAETGQSPQIKR